MNTGELCDALVLTLARRISDAATALDFLKNLGTPDQRAASARHIETLHDIAGMLHPGLYATADGSGDPAVRGWASVAAGIEPAAECGDPATGQPCRNASAAACGECLALINETERAHATA